MKPKRSFYFYETFICYKWCLKLNFYMSKKSELKFCYGFKSLVKLGVKKINFEIPYCRTVFNFSSKTSKIKRWFFLFLVNFLSFFHAQFQFFAGLGGIFEKKYIIFLIKHFNFCGAGCSFWELFFHFFVIFHETFQLFGGAGRSF